MHAALTVACLCLGDAFQGPPRLAPRRALRADGRNAAVAAVEAERRPLAARVRTHGIVTTKYTIEDRQYEMYDVGGQRNERRKWAHCFEGVTGIIFVASLSDYDQKMFEDETTNRMKDSVYLFRDICANPAFAETPIILFLNKRDLFQKKIRDVRIGGEGCFRDYDGPPNDYAAGVDYFLRYFLKQNRDPDRKVFHHVTCATDTANVQVVMDSTRAMIIQDSLNF